MKSDFKDYYDVGMGLGFDKDDIVYERYANKVEGPQRFPIWETGRYWGTCEKSLWTSGYMIGFCGKLYPLIKVNIDSPLLSGEWACKDDRQTVACCFSVEDIDKYVQEHFPKYYNDYETPWNHRRGRTPWHAGQRRVAFVEFFKKCEEFARDEKSRYMRHFEENRTPIFVSRYSWNAFERRYDSWIEYNAALRPYGFMRVFDPFHAFQEINMWLNNQAVPMKPIPEIDNNTMIEAKGFDTKTSFRKEKQKK